MIAMLISLHALCYNINLYGILLCSCSCSYMCVSSLHCNHSRISMRVQSLLLRPINVFHLVSTGTDNAEHISMAFVRCWVPSRSSLTTKWDYRVEKKNKNAFSGEICAFRWNICVRMLNRWDENQNNGMHSGEVIECVHGNAHINDFHWTWDYQPTSHSNVYFMIYGSNVSWVSEWMWFSFVYWKKNNVNDKC